MLRHRINVGRIQNRRIFPVGAAVFLPTDIAGLQLWLRPNDAATVFQDAAKTIPAGNGDVVGGWEEKSGSGRPDATQTTTAQKGILQTGIANGKSIIRFDGTDDNYDLGDYSDLTAAEIFIVVAVDTDPPVGLSTPGLWTFGSSGTVTLYPFTDSKIYDSFGSTVRKTTVDPVADLTQFNLYNVVSIAGEWTNRLNGTQLFTTGTNTVGFDAT